MPRGILIRAAQTVLFAVILSASAGAERAAASLITLIHEGSAGGTLDGMPFSGAFTITATGDVADVEVLDPVLGNGVFLLHDTATIDIVGGTFDILTESYTLVNNTLERVTFDVLNVPFPGGPLPMTAFSGPADAVFQSYGLTTSIGPVAGSGTVFNLSNPIDTSGGALFFDAGSTDARFTAVIPLPAALPLFAAGLAALGFLGRRRGS